MKSLLLFSFLLTIPSVRSAPLKVAVISPPGTLRDTITASGAVVETDPLNAEVIVVRGGDVNPEILNGAAKRGAGLVVLGSRTLESSGGDKTAWRALAGGAWTENSHRFGGKMMLYPLTDGDPVTRDASAFDIEDDTAYDLDLAKEIRVLGSAFTPKVTSRRKDPRAPEKLDRANVYDIQPQMWTYEDGGDKHRAFVLLQDGEETLKHPSIRTLILRGTAWAGRRENVDELCRPEDLTELRYPKDGPRKAEDTVKSFELPPGFSATAIASEPLINKAIAMQWDGQGRLWVAETPEYPNGRRPLTEAAWKETGVLHPGDYARPATDRISILEDTDGDGRMDKKSVFCTGLELVTGFCLYRDGVILVHQPDILYIHGQGADQKVERLFTGFTPGDTHFVANHFMAGMDGWIYANTGSGAQAVSIPHPEVKGTVSPGVFRFRPDGGAIQQAGSKGGNAFGLDITSDGELFAGQATSGNPVQHVVLPEWILGKGKVGGAGSVESVLNQRKVIRSDMPVRVPYMQIDLVGSYSSACAATVQEGGAWPREWADTVFCTEPILDIIHCERLVPAGPTFTGDLFLKDREWLRAGDFRFFPIDVQFGPDGAMYVLDFYNPIVAHSDSRGPRLSTSGASVRPDREHYFGRIYRIQHDQAETLTIPDLTRAAPAELVAHFSHPNKRTRFLAQQLLLEKPAAEAARAVPALKALAEAEAESAGKSTAGEASVLPSVSVSARILALWSLQRLGALEPEALKSALRSTDSGVRKNGLLITEAEGLKSTTDVSFLLKDSDARVRLLALRAMSSTPLTAEASSRLLAVLPDLKDDWSRSAAAAAASSNAAPVLLAALSGGEPPGGALLDLAKSLTTAVTDAGDSAALSAILTACAKADTALKPLVVAVLETASIHPPPVPPADAASGLNAVLRALLDPARADMAAAALPMAAAWGRGGELKPLLAESITALAALAADSRQNEFLRAAAVRGLVRSRQADASVIPAVLALLKTNPGDFLTVESISSLAATGDDRLGPALVEVLASLAPAGQNALYDALLSRSAWAAALLDALESKQLPVSLPGPARLSRLRQHPDPAVRARAVAVIDALGGGTNPRKDQLIADLQPEIESKPGDAARGKLIFSAACGICHKINNEGQDVGPVLDGIGVHGTHELLVHILDPGRMVDNEHRTWSLTLKNGQFLTGIIARENDRGVTLKLPGGIRQDVKTEDIQSRVDTGLSLMPEGLEGLGADNLRDMLAFLSQGSGKYQALQLGRAFTTDTGGGLYQSREARDDTVQPKKYGVTTVEGVPFSLPDPGTTPTGGNVIVLKSGENGSYAGTLPRRVEIPVGFAAGNLHFLGGVAGWGGGAGSRRPAMKVTIEHGDGKIQIEELFTGDVFLDYVSGDDVPGSKRVDGLTTRAHVRYFQLPVNDRSPIRRLVLESYLNGIAPTTLAITADTEAPRPKSPAAGNPAAQGK
ncbi:MAG: PVC-type heme-binding CxxCH protein [Verrucomicrobiota bacterium]